MADIIMFTPEEIAQAEQERKRQEEAERDFVRKLMNTVRLWDQCEHRVCRRQRSCVKTQTCQTRYAAEIDRWYLKCFIPYLRERYPNVQWGAPRGIWEVQFEAARAAEREAQTEGRPVPAKRRRRVPRHPLYMPRDFMNEQA